AQVEIEDLPIPGKRIIDIADLDRDMIDADKLWLLAVTHFEPSLTRLRRRADALLAMTAPLLSLRAQRSNLVEGAVEERRQTWRKILSRRLPAPARRVLPAMVGRPRRRC